MKFFILSLCIILVWHHNYKISANQSDIIHKQNQSIVPVLVFWRLNKSFLVDLLFNQSLQVLIKIKP